MKKVIVLIICFGFSVISFAQDYKFGKVSKAELEEKFNPLDSSANATYLYKKRRSFFEYNQENGFQLVTDVHVRLKMYTEEGFDYASETISLYNGRGGDEEFSGLKAYTYNLIDGKIEDTKLKKDGVFKTERSKYYNQVKFTMPNIKKGAVVEYKYRVTSPYYQNVDEFVLQEHIPIKKLEMKFEVPEYFSFKPNTKGFISVVPEVEQKRGKITLRSKTRSKQIGFNPTKATFHTENIDFEKKVSSYDLNNVPALIDESYVNNINNYRSSVKYELSYTNFPNSNVQSYSSNWEDVVKSIYESENFGQELDKSGYYKDDIDALIGNVSGENEKIALIYNYVKTKLKWDGYYGKYTSKGVKKAYKDQVGNIAEINLMLTSMLRYAGLSANPVLVSTRNNGIPLFPTRQGYNYVIACVEQQNNVILLDASDKYSSPNILPYRVLNWEGRIIREHGSSALIDLYPKQKSSRTISMMVDLDDEGSIHGSIRTTNTKHRALRYRQSYIESDKDQYLENLENKYDGIEVSDFVVKNEEALTKPIMETYKFDHEGQADVIGNKLFVSPMLFLRSTENPFKLEKREYPVDFGYPSVTKYRINIKIPEGYIVESMPEPKVMSLPDNLGNFKYIISSNRSMIQLTVDTQINESIIPALYYEALKEYFKQLVEKENEKVVLIKA